MTTQPNGVVAPSRSAMLSRISAVQQMMGASPLTVESPVMRPTVVGAEGITEVEELLVDEGLGRSGIDGTPAVIFDRPRRRFVSAPERHEVSGEGDE